MNKYNSERLDYVNNDIKITSELKDNIEEEVENDILDFFQNIINCCSQGRKEYLEFLFSKTVDVQELLSVLNKERLMLKLCACSNEIIKSRNIKPNSEKYASLSNDELYERLSDLNKRVNSTLINIQREYNELFDIDDEEEYSRVQKRRKKFRQYSELLKSMNAVVDSFVNITPVGLNTLENTLTAESELVSELKSNTYYSPQLSEQAFFDWLMSNGNISDSTARNCLYDIRSIEKIYQKLFGVKRKIYGAASVDDVKSIIENLTHKAEYIEINKQRHGRYNVSLKKFAQFAGTSADRVNNPNRLQQYQIKTVDFNNPYTYVKCKPLSFTLYNKKYDVVNWTDLYAKFLGLLYDNNNYVGFLKNLIDKPLYGNRVDFSDKANSKELNRAVEVTPDFFAEGNLSAPHIIKHIKYLMELCSIDNDHMIIEYVAQNNNADKTEKPKEADLNNSDNDITVLEAEIENKKELSIKTKTEKAAENDDISNGIILKINGNKITAYNFSDALNKVCEFSINYKPFRMARISKQDIKLNGKNVFYRKANPVDGYNKLSNGLQLIAIDSLSDLQTVTAEVQKYCQIPDDMITIVC